VTKRVLIAVDGTKASNTALEIACALADSYEAKLGLLCVVEPGRISDDLIAGALVEGVLSRRDYNTFYQNAVRTPGGFAVHEEAQRGAYMTRLAGVIADSIVAEAEAFGRKSAAKAIKTFIRTGDPAEEILGVARANDADLIIMGHDRQGRLESLIKGSVAEKVEREAHCPCLIYCLPKQD